MKWYADTPSPIRYQHPVRVYVPVFQTGNTFTYSYADATQDEQLAWSLKPDYVLELKGVFDATKKVSR